MVCAVGHSAAAACAAIRADLAGFVELRYVDDDGDPIRGAPVPGLPHPERPAERLWTMLAMSVSDCLAGAPWARREGLPLLVGIAEPDRPGGLRAPRPEDFVEDIGGRIGVRLHPELSRVVATGHTAGFR